MRERPISPILNPSFEVSRKAIGAWTFGGHILANEILRDYLPQKPSIINAGTPTVTKFRDNTLNFSGDNNADRVDFGTVPTGNPLQGSYPFCILARFFAGGGSPGNSFWRLIDKSSAGNAANGWAIWMNSSGYRFEFGINNPGSTYATSGFGIATGVWHNVLLKLNGSNYLYYMDGVQIGSGSYSQSFVNSATNMAVGNWNHSTDRNWFGRISFVVLSLCYPKDNECRILTQQANPFRIFLNMSEFPFPQIFMSGAAPFVGDRRMFHSARRP